MMVKDRQTNQDAVPGQPAMVGQRRLLTILFCDLVGFTPLSQSMDPEEFAELILAYQETGKRIFTSYGGYIAQFLGDGLLVYFGFPQAHENDAERSVRASLDMLAELERISLEYGATTKLSARIGIHTGQGVIVEGARTEHGIVFGDTVNIASRIEALAPHDTVVISEATRQLLPDRFNTRSIGKPALKGVAQPLELHEVTGLVESGPRSRAWLEQFVFVDRVEQAAELKALWQNTRRGKRCAAIIVGEPGVGKSGLLGLFRQTIAHQPHTWLEARCDSLSSGRPFDPIINLIKTSIGITEDLTPDQARERLLLALKDLPAPVDTTFPLIANLLGIQDEVHTSPRSENPEGVRRQTLETIGLWLEQIAKLRPLVIVCEDLHWCDATTLELLSSITSKDDELPILTLLTSRPSFKSPSIDGMMLIPLEALEAEDAEELVKVRSGQRDLPPAKIDEILSRASGNPLFIEELTKSVARSGKDGDAGSVVPDTLDGLLMGRLDRLPDDVKRVAQVASVFGRTFEPSRLAIASELSLEMIESATEELIDADILRRDPNAGDVLRFRHALTQDAAYYSLLKRERRKTHAQAAKAFQQALGEDGEALRPDLVAHHLAGADRFFEAGEWFYRAGREAAARAALEDAINLYSRGLSALERAGAAAGRDELELNLQIMLGNALMGTRGFGAEEVVPVWNRALALAEHLDNHAEKTSALNGLAAYYIGIGDCYQGAEYGERILALSKPGEDRVGRLRAHSSISTALSQVGQTKQAVWHGEQAVALYKPDDYHLVTYGIGTDQGVVAHGALASAQWLVGLQDSALETTLRAVEIAEDLDSMLSIAAAHSYQALILHQRQDREAAYRIASDNVAFCERYHIQFWQGFSQLIKSGQQVDPTDKRIEDLNAALQLLGRLGSRTGAALGFSMLANAHQDAGNWDLSIAILDAGIQTSATLKQSFWDAELLRQKGMALLETDKEEIAEQTLRKAHALAIGQGSLPLQLRSAITLGRYLESCDQLFEAQDIVRQAAAQCMEGRETRDMLDAARYLS